MEFDATRRYDLAAHGDGCHERQRMAVVHMDHVRLERGNRAAQVPPGAGIQADLPRGAEHADAAGRGALCQLAALFGDERLLDLRLAAELAAEEPHLVLAPPPFPARVNL